jgi:hypothetical protein
LSDPNIPPKERFILNGFLAVPYFSARRSVPITAVYIGSERDVPLTPSTSVAIPIDAGSLR